MLTCESRTRIGALLLRQYYLLRSSPSRLIEILFWPTLDVTVWGFANLYLADQSGLIMRSAQFLLGAALLWQVLIRSEINMLLVFLEEMWSRNFGHLFVSPLRPHEFVLSIIIASVLRTVVGTGIALLVATLLFPGNLLPFSLPLAMMVFLLFMMGWSVGLLLIALIFRLGMGGEWLVWMAAFAVMPLTCVFYPVSVLPALLQPVALLIPATHVFEGMRAILGGNSLPVEHILAAFGLNLLLLLLSSQVLMRALRYARTNAVFVQQGE